MTKTSNEIYYLTITRKGGEKTKRQFHTIKSARLYAKEACNHFDVTLMVLAGPDLAPTTIYS